MPTDVTSAFAAYFARNTGPIPGNPHVRQRPNYKVAAVMENGAIELSLGFRSGFAYCCYEWGCHLALYQHYRWNWLRWRLIDCGVAVPYRIELRLSVEIESGALFFDLLNPIPTPGVRRWYPFVPSEALDYQVTVVEAEHPDIVEGG